LRAADLLEASGATATGFSVGIAFTGVDSVTLGGDETSVECDDVDFSLVIKRMSKKDSTTKLKVTCMSLEFIMNCYTVVCYGLCNM